MTTNNLSESQSYILYYHPYSICSLMVLYTLALRGQSTNAESEINVELKTIDMFHAEQIEEWFLRDINVLGQIPVLVQKAKQEAPICDSLEITLFMASKYPDLLPVGYEDQIRPFLIGLHDLNKFSLSFSALPRVGQAISEAVKSRLADTKISCQYREILEFKHKLVQHDRVDALLPTEAARWESQARVLLSSMERLVKNHKQWLFGGRPTALDAHLVVLIARLIEVGKSNLIPQALQEYGAHAMSRPEWIQMMDGRKTVAFSS